MSMLQIFAIVFVVPAVGLHISRSSAPSLLQKETEKGSCMQTWCDAIKVPWENKCTWEPTCKGCSQCAKVCPEWCAVSPISWNVKLTWEGCEPCGGNLRGQVAVDASRSREKGRRIAVLMRGAIFRQGSGTCSFNPVVNAHQEEATRTFVKYIIEPFEWAGNTVDIFVTASSCSRIADIVKMLGKGRVRQTASFDTDDQSDSVRKALEAFKQAIGGIEAAASYDQIIFTRHDLIFQEHMIEAMSLIDPNKFSFLSSCYDMMKTLSHFDSCRLDTFFIMPGYLFDAFDQAVGSRYCFLPGEEYENHDDAMCFDSGHCCLRALNRVLQNASMPGSENSFQYGNILDNVNIAPYLYPLNGDDYHSHQGSHPWDTLN